MLALLLSACASQRTLESLAVPSGTELRQVQAGPFSLALLRNPAPPAARGLTIYLGGDGSPWAGNRPASNPTGSGLMAAELALADSGPALYLGRPCYHLAEMPEACTEVLWTSGRYSDTVVAAMTDAVAAQAGDGPLTLVGYSGGGVLALLVAERVPAVTRVVTVAANLDTEAWTRYHGLLPLDRSLNPAADLPAPTRFAQVHLYAEHDAVVPPATIAGYRQRQAQATYLQVDGFDHRCCWRRHWPAILARIDELTGSQPEAPPAAAISVPTGPGD